MKKIPEQYREEMSKLVYEDANFCELAMTIELFESRFLVEHTLADYFENDFILEVFNRNSGYMQKDIKIRLENNIFRPTEKSSLADTQMKKIEHYQECVHYVNDKLLYYAKKIMRESAMELSGAIKECIENKAIFAKSELPREIKCLVSFLKKYEEVEVFQFYTFKTNPVTVNHKGQPTVEYEVEISNRVARIQVKVLAVYGNKWNFYFEDMKLVAGFSDEGKVFSCWQQTMDFIKYAMVDSKYSSKQLQIAINWLDDEAYIIEKTGKEGIFCVIDKRYKESGEYVLNNCGYVTEYTVDDIMKFATDILYNKLRERVSGKTNDDGEQERWLNQLEILSEKKFYIERSIDDVLEPDKLIMKDKKEVISRKKVSSN